MSSYHTEQKKSLLDFLTKNKDKSFTIDEITENIQSDSASVGRSTVYRLVNRLVDEGKVRRFLKSDSRSASYQLVAGEHCECHLHLKCLGCGKLFHMDEEISDELVESIRRLSAFSVDEEESVLYGKCAACTPKRIGGGL